MIISTNVKVMFLGKGGDKEESGGDRENTGDKHKQQHPGFTLEWI